MKRNITKFLDKTFDLLVIGGGINGAAITHLAAKEGLSVAMIDKGDFASGSSSKSTKLIHGGLRYLENFEIDLVRESLSERKVQLKAAPHLVKPLKFIIPIYKKDHRNLFYIKAGLILYDLLSGKDNIHRHRFIKQDELIKLEPNIKKEGLKGGFLYYDAQMNDARLCLENVLESDKCQAVVANYVKAENFLKEIDEKISGVHACDLISQKTFDIKAKKIVSATGPWTDEILNLSEKGNSKKMCPTKGIHLVYGHQLSQHAILRTTKKDKRIFFIIPWMGQSLIGTTDTYYEGDPDHVDASKEDIDYLLREVETLMPEVTIRKEKISSVFAGLRPLIDTKSVPSKISRKHYIFKSKSNILYVTGGKYTTYRKIALDCLSQITESKAKEPFSLYGGGRVKETIEDISQKYSLDSRIVENILDTYGNKYQDVLNYILKDHQYRKLIYDTPPVILAQVRYAIDVEMAQTAEDIIFRRLMIGHLGKLNDDVLDDIKKEFEK